MSVEECHDDTRIKAPLALGLAANTPQCRDDWASMAAMGAHALSVTPTMSATPITAIVAEPFAFLGGGVFKEAIATRHILQN